MKKALKSGISVAVCAFVAAGCSGGVKDSGKENVKADTVDLNAPIEITMTSSAGTASDSFNASVTSYLQKKFPNWKFNYIQKGPGSSIQELVTAGTSVDLIFEAQTGVIDGLIAPGLQTDISDLVKKNNIDLSRFEPVSIDAMKSLANGGLYGLPISMMGIVTFYNKDIFDKFGIPYPKDGMTWDETIDLGRKLTRMEDGVSYIGLAASTGHVLKLNPFSIPYVDADSSKSTYGNDKWKIVMDTIFKGESTDPLFIEYMKGNNNKVPAKDEFLKKKNLAMYVYFSDLVADGLAPSVNFDMVSAPTFKELPGVGFQPYPTYVNLSSASKNKEAAMEVIKYLVSDEYQAARAKLGYITPLKDDAIRKSMGSEYPKKLNWNAVFYNKYPEVPKKGKFDSIGEKPLTDNIPGYIMGGLDTNTVLRQAEETANKAIEAEQKK
ncbi:extracellular solute-binding protein [Paenibacillus sp. OAS669]|uniref:ABC transporter substrate-binding protein n=1 Tax=Paenibacillus sp. OAS669 TaxID=2663821 RepID=UPI00178A2E3F|nr:extracellular solute-binding protein [Paenibacillus sp. OAS669]MBE1446849.1 multiple sugar transport system substrate-binding protein [Paenibacillus sp. OAS669]